MPQLPLVLPPLGNLGRSRQDKPKINQHLEKIGGIGRRAQGPHLLHAQHPHLEPLGKKAQGHGGKLQNIQHHRVFQQAVAGAVLPFFF